MYIPPFWVGVITTIVVETIAFIIFCYICYKKR